MEKLKKHGIVGNLLGVIGDWLRNRKQRVCIKGRCQMVKKLDISLEWGSAGFGTGTSVVPDIYLIWIKSLIVILYTRLLKLNFLKS